MSGWEFLLAVSLGVSARISERGPVSQVADAARRPQAVDAARSGIKLPRAASKAVRAGRATLWQVGTRHVVRPAPWWLGGAEDRVATVWVGEAGQAWRRVELPPCGNAGCILDVSPDGTLDFMTGTEASCGGGGQQWLVGHLDGRPFESAPWPWDSPLAFSLPGEGWAAGACDAGDLRDAGVPDMGLESIHCIVNRRGETVLFPVAYDGPDGESTGIAIEGDVAVVGGRTFLLTAGGPREVFP